LLFICSFLIVGVSDFLEQLYSDLMSFFYQSKTSSIQSCLALCLCNQSCVAVSYDQNTSTCFLSNSLNIVNSTEQTAKACYVKKMYSELLMIYGSSTSLAKGNIKMSNCPKGFLVFNNRNQIK